MTHTHHNPVLSEHEANELRLLIEQRSGIVFDSSRERFFSSRALEHMEGRRLRFGAELLRLVRGSNVEYEALLERLLTQETRFFRYPDVFAAFERRVLAEQHQKKFWSNTRSLRVWSAGCATGEEPYSIAISICEALPSPDSWQVEVLATDVSKEALARAERGVYSRRAMEHVAPNRVETYFTGNHDHFEVKARLRSLVRFAPLNLAETIYLGKFDVIFCMNVLIYFSEERRAELIQKFFEYLEPGGYLFLGHAESAAKVPTRFESLVVGDARLLRKPERDGVRAAVAGEGR